MRTRIRARARASIEDSAVDAPPRPVDQPSGGLGGTASDIRIQAEQSLHIKSTMQRLIAEHTGQTLDQIESDSDRDRWFTAYEARAYGLIDHVVTSLEDIRPGGRGTIGLAVL